MSTGSAIEWTDATWNPTTGCTPVSPGCLNCYAARDAVRMAGNPNPKISSKYAGLAVIRDGRAVFNGTVRRHEDRLEIPLHWRSPRMVFVDSQSDLFHETVPFEFIDRVFAVMALCPQHTFQVLTKRPERMAEYLATRTPIGDVPRVEHMPQWYQVATAMLDSGATSMPRGAWDRGHDGMPDPSQPLPNVWLGTSVENQATADERIPHLLRCPAAVRFVSAEPLLGAVDLTRLGYGAHRLVDALAGDLMLDREEESEQPEICAAAPGSISWVIVGGESGPNARACDVASIRSIRNRCKAAGVACFVKQLGARPFDPLMVGPDPPREIWPNGTRFETSPRKSDAVWQCTGFAKLHDKKGGEISEWPADLRVREMPSQ